MKRSRSCAFIFTSTQRFLNSIVFSIDCEGEKHRYHFHWLCLLDGVIIDYIATVKGTVWRGRDYAFWDENVEIKTETNLFPNIGDIFLAYKKWGTELWVWIFSIRARPLSCPTCSASNSAHGLAQWKYSCAIWLIYVGCVFTALPQTWK